MARFMIRINSQIEMAIGEFLVGTSKELSCRADGIYTKEIPFSLAFKVTADNFPMRKVSRQLFNPCKGDCRHSDTVDCGALKPLFWDALKITPATAFCGALVSNW